MLLWVSLDFFFYNMLYVPLDVDIKKLILHEKRSMFVVNNYPCVHIHFLGNLLPFQKYKNIVRTYLFILCTYNTYPVFHIFKKVCKLVTFILFNTRENFNNIQDFSVMTKEYRYYYIKFPIKKFK